MIVVRFNFFLLTYFLSFFFSLFLSFFLSFFYIVSFRFYSLHSFLYFPFFPISILFFFLSFISILFLFLCYSLWQYTEADPHYPNFLKPLLAIGSSLIFLISGQGYFTFFTDTWNTTYTTERLEEKKNNHGLGLAPSARREKSVRVLCSSPCVCRPSRACIRPKFPQSH